MKIVTTTLGVITLAVLALLAVMYTGAFNIATAWEDPALLRWVLVTTRESSIERRAQTVQAPDLDVTNRINNGFHRYREACALCHTPPGGKLSPLAKGLNPEPPDLSKGEDVMSDAEVFWVLKNGIRMTGMPAWSPAYSDQELWDIVAFLKALPDLGTEGYRALDSKWPPGRK
ncbi:MAG TPA: cytochrome c [Marinobacter sp.]|uniref:Cytochrome c n=2 Tax=root TaxID=1 RepID=A0A831R5F1_9GAMM|nr:cytochrome c [Marinobacter antarcticus]HDZ36712.1 cytochrome c [Marinobacter sp.]HEA53123.1 cytochrome c [Marinobacter antarcticus]